MKTFVKKETYYNDRSFEERIISRRDKNQFHSVIFTQVEYE